MLSVKSKMNNKKTILFSLLISLLVVYVILYYTSVKPYNPEAEKSFMQLSRGWDPTYTYHKNPSTRPPYQIVPGNWNNFAYKFFTPIHQLDRIVRKDLWLSEAEKQAITLRASQPLEAPLNIQEWGMSMDGGSILINGTDKNSTGFQIILHQSIKIQKEDLPRYITINDRKLVVGGPEEQQLAMDLNNWLKNNSDDAHCQTVKEMVNIISDRT